MSFQDDLVSDQNEILFDTDEFAKNATYTPLGGVGAAIKVNKKDSVALQQSGEGNKENATFTLPKNFFSFPSKPKYKDSILISGDSTAWTVIRVLAESGVSYLVEAHRDARGYYG